ncbi:MAG: hypothetical protein ACRYG2_29940 [Janthinobacterium lividum]
MSESAPPETVGRRHLLGRGAALAGTAAAGAIALGAAGTRSAEADSGDNLIAGRFNYAESITRITKRNTYSFQPTLELVNSQNGPTLQLDPVVDETKLEGAQVPEPGGFFTILERPVYAANEDDNSFTVGLATLDDIDLVQQPYVTAPFRILDTTKTFPGQVLDTKNFDASGRLRGGRYIDLVVGTAYDDEQFTTKGVFLNVHSSGSTANGVLAVYPPGDNKETTLHFTKGVAVANFAVTPVARIKDPEGGPSDYIRIYTSATTHIQLDFLGAIRNHVSPVPGAAPPHRIRRPRSAARRITNKLKAPR